MGMLPDIRHEGENRSLYRLSSPYGITSALIEEEYRYGDGEWVKGQQEAILID